MDKNYIHTKVIIGNNNDDNDNNDNEVNDSLDDTNEKSLSKIHSDKDNLVCRSKPFLFFN
jgi:hypothetical protein